MAVLQMRRVNICGMKKCRKAVLERLQALGVMELSMEVQDDDLERMDTISSRNHFEKSAQQLEQALEVLQQYVPEKKSLLSSFEGKTLVEAQEYQKLAQQAADVVVTARQRLPSWKIKRKP